jgi:hypothetical protein
MMSKKFILTLVLAGALALPFSTIPKEDRSIVVTKEEQNLRENMQMKGQDTSITITAGEQNTIENSSVKQGFFQQENGTGFFFSK